MVNKTPLRLVAIEESPEGAEDHSAAPIRPMGENEAITRKVPAAAMAATAEPAPPPMPRAKSLLRWQILAPAGGAVVALAVVLIAVLGGGKSKDAPSPAPAPVEQAGRQPALPPAAPVQPVAAAPAVRPPEAKGGAEVIRLQITAEPIEAELSLDGNVLAGHRLNIEVPRDRGIHVVSASAPGYLPFNQQVVFTSDVVLNISLRKARGREVARPAARSRSAQAESRPKSEVRSAPAQPSPSLEPGMNLDRPSMRHAKPIDERNPYNP